MRDRRAPRREADPVELLLDFMLALKRFMDAYGRRSAHADFDDELTQALGMDATLNDLRNRRELRRIGTDPGPLVRVRRERWCAKDRGAR